MRRALAFTAGLLLAGGSTLGLAQGQPENLLPPGLDDPAPSAPPTAGPTRAPRQPAVQTPPPAPTVAPAHSGPASRPGEVVQPLPGLDGSGGPEGTIGSGIDLSRLPTLEQLEAMSTDELDTLFGLKPTVDIPPSAQRSMERVGVFDPQEGGLPVFSLANQPAALVRAALAGTKGPVVSRWGHILLRRALVSRLAAPAGMDPAEFAALRAGLLNRIGEFAAARALAQDVDTANYSPALSDAALAAYVGTADILGACPAVRLGRTDRTDGEWRMIAAICNAYSGEEIAAGNDLRRLLNRGDAPAIDARLAQRYAGAAGSGRRVVTIEWKGVSQLTPWRFAVANAVGASIPDALISGPPPYYAMAGATAPMLTAAQRLPWADAAARRGVLSAGAMVDLYSQLFEDVDEGPLADAARTLRAAYVGADAGARFNAIRTLWGDGTGDPYGKWVLTAFAAARLDPSDAFAAESGPLIGSMLAAGLDRDAARWAPVVPVGSLGWALIALSRPNGPAVSGGSLGDFLGADESAGKRKSAMLVAGLAALGRATDGTVSGYGEDVGVDLTRSSRWTQAIDGAAAGRNQALVVLLAGLGMQGESWDRMTALHLFHIVRALNHVGLGAEARMIAAEAVARA